MFEATCKRYSLQIKSDVGSGELANFLAPTAKDAAVLARGFIKRLQVPKEKVKLICINDAKGTPILGKYHFE